MQALALQLRALQFLAHRAHNECNGDTFFQDHSFLGGLYKSYEEHYDNVIERIIGLENEQISISKINQQAAEMSSVNPVSKDCAVFFKILLKGEEDVCTLVKAMAPKATDGTQNLLQAIADESEKTQYKLKKRLAII